MRRTLAALILAASLAIGAAPASLTAVAAEAAARAFATPEAALADLRLALAKNDIDGLIAMFGSDHDDLVLGADPASARVERQRAAAALNEKMTLRKDGEDQITLILGKQKWPMPIPLRRTDRGWVFDAAAGEHEIYARRIGEDELAAIAALKAFVHAQSDYAARTAKQSGSREYARYLQSTSGQTDGLWWDQRTAVRAGPSPLADFVRAQRDFLAKREPGDRRSRPSGHHPLPRQSGHSLRSRHRRDGRRPSGCRLSKRGVTVRGPSPLTSYEAGTRHLTSSALVQDPPPSTRHPRLAHVSIETRLLAVRRSLAPRGRLRRIGDANEEDAVGGPDNGIGGLLGHRAGENRHDAVRAGS
jgi:hypothetical protein